MRDKKFPKIQEGKEAKKQESKKAIQESKKAKKQKKIAGQKISKKPVLQKTVPKFGTFNKMLAWGVTAIFLFIILSVLSSHEISDNAADNFATPENLQTVTLNLTSDKNSITLIATGDILLARFVELNMRKLGDYMYPFRKVAEFLKSADITFGNLENPLCRGPNTPTDSTTFRGDTEGIQGLLHAGFDVLSLANNHMMNYKAPCMQTTIVELKKAGIFSSGAGNNQNEAHTPAIVMLRGRKIAFHSYVDTKIPGWLGIAKHNEPGVARMDIVAMTSDVKNALAHDTDIVIVSMHAGKEYTREPTQFQRDFAHAAIDTGASVVIGHHPHWVQPCEEYNGGIICYSLGNFVFDQFWSWDTQIGLVTKIIFDEDLETPPRLQLFPVKLDKAQPRILEGEERLEVMKRLGI